MAEITPTPRAGTWLVGVNPADADEPPRAGSWLRGQGNFDQPMAGTWLVGTTDLAVTRIRRGLGIIHS